MKAEIIRHMIDQHGRSTLIQAVNLSREDISVNAIAGDLGIDWEDVSDCVKAGESIIAMRDEQRRFEAAIE